MAYPEKMIKIGTILKWYLWLETVTLTIATK
jgi:hypothetical protein